jgi:glycosylphosphatidylinositol transamidase
LLLALAPAAVIHAGAWYWTVPLEEVLTEAAFGWNVVGMYTQFVVCCVWWPAWVVGATVVLSKPKAGNRA